MIRPILAEEQANLNGIRYRDVTAVLLQGFEGDVMVLYGDVPLVQAEFVAELLGRHRASPHNDVSRTTWQRCSSSRTSLWRPVPVARWWSSPRDRSASSC